MITASVTATKGFDNKPTFIVRDTDHPKKCHDGGAYIIDVLCPNDPSDLGDFLSISHPTAVVIMM